MDEIGSAIRKLRVDQSGVENTMHAIRETVDAYAGLIGKDRKMLLVLVTDESGDDGADVEEARQALKKYKVPLYVIGRQSLFGYPFAHHRYLDPLTKDVYNPVIRRGPESADVEIYQWDGLYDRWDEQPSGFAPWELARLTRESGGIYFLLPSEEFMRARKREQAYSIVQLKEYLPEYDSRQTYLQNRNGRDLRRSLVGLVDQTRDFRYRRDFPIDPGELSQAAAAEVEKATLKLNALLEIEERLDHPQGTARARTSTPMAGPLRPDARADRGIPGQGLRVPGADEADRVAAPPTEQAADARPGYHVRGRPRSEAASPPGRDGQEVCRGT